MAVPQQRVVPWDDAHLIVVISRPDAFCRAGPAGADLRGSRARHAAPLRLQLHCDSLEQD